MTSPPPSKYVRELREALVDAAAKQNKRRHARTRFAQSGFAIAACLLVFVGYTRTTEQPTAASTVSVRTVNGAIQVDLTDTNPRPKDLVHDLKEKGITATVDTLSSPPQGVGKFLTVAEERDAQQTSIATEHMTYRSFTVSGPIKSVHITLGRKAEPGERYQTAMSSYIDGGRLHCSGLFGKPVAEAEAELNTLGVKITWQHLADGSVQTMDSLPAELRNGYISNASDTASDEISIYVTEEPGWATAAGNDVNDSSCPD